MNQPVKTQQLSVFFTLLFPTFRRIYSFFLHRIKKAIFSCFARTLLQENVLFGLALWLFGIKLVSCFHFRSSLPNILVNIWDFLCIYYPILAIFSVISSRSILESNTIRNSFTRSRVQVLKIILFFTILGLFKVCIFIFLKKFTS